MREIISRKDALAKGMNRYFTGKKCKNNHIDQRSVIDFACVSCRNEIRKKIASMLFSLKKPIMVNSKGVIR